MYGLLQAKNAFLANLAVFKRADGRRTYLAFNASNQNLGKSYYTGIDFEAIARKTVQEHLERLAGRG